MKSSSTWFVVFGSNQIPVPFTTGPGFTVAGGAVVVLQGNDEQFMVVDSTGRVTRRFGVRWPTRSVDAGVEEAFRRSVEALPLPEAYREDWLAQVEHEAVPDHLPHYDLISGTAEGEVWARRYEVDPLEGPVWDVFSLEGDWIAEARFAPGFLLFGVDAEWVYGVARDSLDVEYVQLFPRPGATS